MARSASEPYFTLRSTVATCQVASFKARSGAPPQPGWRSALARASIPSSSWASWIRIDGRNRITVPPGGQDEDASLLHRLDHGSRGFLQLDGQHHAAAADLADLTQAEFANALLEARALLGRLGM
jgi:hypothetical protein